MSKTKKFFWFIALAATFAAATLFGLLYGVKKSQADFSASVKNVELYFRQAYASAADGGGYRTEYLITFDAEGDVFGAYENGADIKENFPDLGTQITFNGVSVAEFTGGYKVFKYAPNVMRLVVGRPVGYGKITVSNGQIGDYVLSATAVKYENDDGTFSDTEPPYRPNAIFERPYANASLAFMSVAFTRADALDNYAQLNKLLLNGTPLAEEDGTKSANLSSYGNDWDKGISQYQVHLYLVKSALSNGAVLTFVSGYTQGTYTTDKVYAFAVESGAARSDYNNLPAWKPIDGYAGASITYEGMNTGYDYSIKLSGVTNLENAAVSADMFGSFSKGSDMTEYLNKTGLFTQLKVDGTAISAINGAAFKKGEANEIILTLPSRAVTLSLDGGSVVGRAYVKSAVSFADESILNVQISSVNFASRQPYNGATNYGTDYIVTFDTTDDMLPDFSAGDDITAVYPAFGTLVKLNGTNFSSIAGKYEIFKESADSLRIRCGRPIGYAKLSFSAGLLLGDYLLSSDADFYENTDGTFSTAEPPYRINVIYEFPYGASGAVAALTLCTTRSASVGSAAQFYGVKLNGENIVDSDGNVLLTDAVVASAAGTISYGNDWDAGSSGTKIYFYLYKSALAGGAVLTFPAGFGFGSYSLSEEQSFAVNAADRNNWAKLPVWRPVTGYANASVEFAERTSNSTSYNLIFSDVTDIAGTAASGDLLAAFEQGDDMTDYIKNTDLINDVSVNNKALSEYNGITFVKGSANTVVITFASTMTAPNFHITGGAVAGDIVIRNTVDLLGLDDDTFFVLDDDLTTKTPVSVSGIYSSFSYGYMSRQNEVLFRVKFSELGMFSDMPVGTDISGYFSDASFTGRVFVNGSAISAIKTATKTLSVYVGARNSEVYNAQDVSGCIEFVLKGMQLFDFDVKFEKDCVFGTVKIAETVTYRKQYDESFAVQTEESGVYPIAVREVPYGAEANTRSLRLIFNDRVTAASGENLIEKITFGSKVTLRNSGKYFNGEAEYGGRSYVINVAADEYQAFLLSETPTITVGALSLAGGKSTESKKFIMKNGVWMEENDANEYIVPQIVEIRHPGNQGNDLKLLQIKFNVSVNHWLIGSFLRDNLYLNGKKVYDYKVQGGYVNPEAQWNCMFFAIYVDDNIRNYNGGVDVIYIPKGAPISAGRMVPEDIYFYGVQNKNERDGAGNWKWTFSNEMPELNILSGGATEKDEYISATVNFDRITAVNEVSFGKYSERDVSALLEINGKPISSYQGASYEWTDDGVKISVKTEDISGDYLTVGFRTGFTVPLGYSFSNDAEITYGFNEKIWLASFDKTNVAAFSGNAVESVEGFKTVRVGDKTENGVVVPKIGLRITVNFKNDIVGTLKLTGTSSHIVWLKNVTANYSDLKALTEAGYLGSEAGVAYEYTPEVLARVVNLGIRDSVLNNILINGRSLNDIAAIETTAEALNNYPITVDFKGKAMYITIQEDSVIFDEFKEDMVLEIRKNLLFETETRTVTDVNLQLKDGEFVEYISVKSITVKNTKQTYYKGQDLDLTKLTAYAVMSDDSRGEDFTVTSDMISGYDKNVVGKQTVTVTAYGKTSVFEVNVIEAPDVTPDSGESGGKKKGGCGSAIDGGTAVLFVLAAAVAVFAFEKGRKRKN